MRSRCWPGIVCTDDPNTGFKDADYALLVGARPRGPGMERKDLLEANAAIFSVQGKAINDNASKDIKVLVVGNPANTNALITQRNAPDIDPRNFTAMTRLDHNRALTQIALKTGTTVNDVSNMTIWGNHSATQYPDLFNAQVNGKAAIELVDQQWYEERFHPHRATARRGDHQGPRRLFRRVSRQRRHRPHAQLGTGYRGRRLGLHGRALGRLLRHCRGPDLLLPLPLRRWRVEHRTGRGSGRVQPRQNGGYREGTGRGTRRGAAPAALGRTATYRAPVAGRQAPFLWAVTAFRSRPGCCNVDP